MHQLSECQHRAARHRWTAIAGHLFVWWTTYHLIKLRRHSLIDCTSMRMLHKSSSVKCAKKTNNFLIKQSHPMEPRSSMWGRVTIASLMVTDHKVRMWSYALGACHLNVARSNAALERGKSLTELFYTLSEFSLPGCGPRSVGGQRHLCACRWSSFVIWSIADETFQLKLNYSWDLKSGNWLITVMKLLFFFL